MTAPGETGNGEPVIPLRDRINVYLRLFGLGWLGIILVGLSVGALSALSTTEGIAYVAMAVGAYLMLAGGMSGGGYRDLGAGAMEALTGLRRHDDEAEPQTAAAEWEKKLAPKTRLQRGMRPEKNPRAFWQVVAGTAYMAGGLSIFVLWSL